MSLSVWLASHRADRQTAGFSVNPMLSCALHTFGIKSSFNRHGSRCQTTKAGTRSDGVLGRLKDGNHNLNREKHLSIRSCLSVWSESGVAFIKYLDVTTHALAPHRPCCTFSYRRSALPSEILHRAPNRVTLGGPPKKNLLFSMLQHLTAY